jgi:carbamoyl-phosphate synthase large subunit
LRPLSGRKKGRKKTQKKRKTHPPNMQKTAQKQPRPVRLLVTSAAAKVPLLRAAQAAVRRLDPTGSVIAGDLDRQAPTQAAADEFWVMPPTVDASRAELLAGCRLRKITHVLPTRDGELLPWAAWRAEFAKYGIQVLVSSESALRCCLDKLAFALFGQEHGFPFVPASEALASFGSPPYAVKERYGSGSRGIGLNLDADAALAHARLMRRPIFQPFISGRELSVDAWLTKASKVKGLVLRWRDRVEHGESQVTTTFRDSELEARCAVWLERLGLSGPVVMQIMLDAQNRPHVIECNPRFGGASTASVAIGLDLLYWSLLEGQGTDIPFTRAHQEIRQIRLAQDILQKL